LFILEQFQQRQQMLDNQNIKGKEKEDFKYYEVPKKE